MDKLETGAEQILTIRNIHPSDRVKSSLISRGYVSSVSIFRKPKDEFLDDVQDLMTLEEAGRAYEQAGRNYMILTHLTAGLNVDYNGVSYRALRKRLASATKKELFENIPNYQEIFGGLDYCDCPQCKSIFGPAAYFVDMMRIIEKHIRMEKDLATVLPVTLRERRPDLYKLKLTCENTNKVKPYLEIVNGILENCIDRGSGLYRELSQTYFPPQMPFCLPAEKIRVWLKRSKLRLGEVLCIYNAKAENVAAAELGISPEQFELLEKPLSDVRLAGFMGQSELDVEALKSLSALLLATGLSRRELEDLFTQDTALEPDQEQETRRQELFINGDKGNSLKIKEETIDNLTRERLDRICRFVRIKKLLGRTDAETDWLIKTAGTDAEGSIHLLTVFQISDFASQTSLDIYTAMALFGRLKDYGDNPFYTVYGYTRGQMAGFTGEELERFLSRTLGVEAGDIRALCDYMGCADADAIYRHCRTARLISMSMEEYLLLLRLLFPNPIQTFDVAQVETVIRVRACTRFNAFALDYFVNGNTSAYFQPAFSEDAIQTRVLWMRKNAPEDCAKDKDLQSEYVYSELGSFFGQETRLKNLLECILNEEQLKALPERVMNADLQELTKTLIPLVRILTLAAGIDADLICTALHYPAFFGMDSAVSLTVEAVLELESFQNYMRIFSDTGKTLLRFAAAYAESGKIELLAEVTGWKESSIQGTFELLYSDKNPEQRLSRLVGALDAGLRVQNRLSLNEAGMKKLLSFQAQWSSYAEMEKIADGFFVPSADDAAQAEIEAAKRGALLPLALAKLRERFEDMTNYDKLYKYFLIDVQMDDKTVLSPVKEGVNALQLYLQRCRMRLERGIREITIPECWWDWIMDYRMWESNRRMFVYPENYLLPSIRHSKTHLFQDVEDALQQSKITDGYIEQQYIKYLDDYFQLTQLKICGAYETVIDNLNVLYVFAHTRKQPYTYYYCKRVSTLAWSEWKKVDTNIDSDTITPVFVFNRLHIFWTVLTERSKVRVETREKTTGNKEEGEQKEDKLEAGNQKAYDLQIKYTYLDLQDKWITPQNLTEETILYAEDGQKESQEIKERSNVFHINPLDESFRKLTLLRLKQSNFEGFIQKDREYECLAVITGTFAQNLGDTLNALNVEDSLDREQTAFTQALNRLTQSNNFEVADGGDGFFSTGFLKIFNEDLEEEHFLHQNEFIVVDGYVPPEGSRIYAAVYDSIHHAVGAYLSQSVLQDAAMSARGILPYENNSAYPAPPKLDENSFVTVESGLIDAALSQNIYLKLKKANIISGGLVDEQMLAYRDLQSLLSDVLLNILTQNQAGSEPAEWVPATQSARNLVSKRNNQILEIQKVLLKNAGAVYLFKKVDRGDIIPVVNQPGKFIFDCTDEAFLVYPVYEEEGRYHEVHMQKLDAGVTVGAPITKGTFVRLGFTTDAARQIFEALDGKIFNDRGIVNREACTRESLSVLLKPVISDGSMELINKIYVKLLNLPLISKSDFDNITGAEAGGICENLSADRNRVLYPAEEANYYRIDLSMLREKNTVLFANKGGGVLTDSSVREIYQRLEDACSSIYFNYRGVGKLPDKFTELPFKSWKFGVQRLTNPTLKKLKRKLETGGIDSFLNRATQSPPVVPVMPFSRLGPTDNVVPPRAEDGAQVDFEGLYAEYNWELFYHLPMTVAQCFCTNSMYSEALRWYHYVFNPTLPDDTSVPNSYWNFYPFAFMEKQKLEDLLKNTEAVQAYNDSPFDPHAIARLRTDAYAKYTVMQYVENLVRWGDSQFILNTWESLTTATMLYVWANDMLGPRPERVGIIRRQEEKSFDDIEAFYAGGDIPQFIIDLERKAQELQAFELPIPVSEAVPFNDIRSYFGVPENTQILQMWDVIEDRLYKLRNSLDINGAPRLTALFEQPLDPAALAKAAAVAGGSSPAGLTRRPSAYPYRFSYMIEQAKAVTAQLSQLSAGLLSALEKGDAEALLLLTGGQEQNVLNMTTAVRESQLQEASSSLEALKVSRKSAELRRDYYRKNAEEYMSTKEIASFATATVAAAMQAMSGTTRFAAGAAHLVPDVGSPFAMVYGGREIGTSMMGIASGFETMAQITAFAGQQTLTMAQYDRRRDDWMLQKQQAEKEMESLDQQIKAAQVRQESARREMEIHRKTLENKEAVLQYLKGKFSGAQLYQWIAGQLSSTLWQTYQLAVDLALSAQEAYGYERDETGIFLTFQYWDSGRRGLMAGENLMLALETMQQSYHRKDFRRLEIEKNISMRQDCPGELQTLIMTGSCDFELNEALFARDYPACYRRKIQSVSLSIPAVLPPYETIKATLKQRESKILMDKKAEGIDYLFNPERDLDDAPDTSIVRDASRHGEVIAVSRGIDDSGVFQLNFSDSRYLPFEGTGVASKWTLEMPRETNRFDLTTITDVIISVRYTALEDETRGEGSLYQYVLKKLMTASIAEETV